MKKLLLLLVVYCTQNIQANKLSDAIRNSDVEQVEFLLLNHAVDQNFTKYLDIADQILQLRRDTITAQRITPHFIKNSEWQLLNQKAMMCLLTAGSLTIPGIYFDELYLKISWDQRDDVTKINYRTVANGFMAAAGIALLASFGYYVISGQRGVQAEWKRIEQLHDDAIIIKELLHDHAHKAREINHLKGHIFVIS